MRIKGITIYGFKSFPEELKINFHPGITIIVGPNGSGKTNIFDSIRWIFGDQSPSNLRCEKIGDLIFLGSETRKPTGFTEVKLTLENTGEFHEFGPEIEIMRRFYRSQESDFYINQSPCRLKDIQDLGLKIGGLSYAFLENSKIKEIIKGNVKMMFDESAGIARYYERREEALRRIARGQDELKRLDDVINEMSRNVRSLKRQANKVEKLKQLEGLRKKAELKNAITRTNQLTKLMAKIKSEFQSLETEEKKRANKIEESKRELTQLEDLITHYEDKLARKKALDWELARLQKESEATTEAIQEIEKDLVKFDKSIKDADSKIENLNKMLHEKEKNLEQTGGQLSEAEEKLSDLIEHRQDYTTTHSDVLAELKSNEILGTRLRNEISRLEGASLKTKEICQEITRDYVSLEADLKDLERKEKQLLEEHQHMCETEDTILEQKKISSNELLEIGAEVQSLKAMAKGQREEFYRQRFKDNFVDMVYNLVRPKPGYEKAVDSLLGEISGYAVLVELDPKLLIDLEDEGIGIIVTNAEKLRKKVKANFGEYPQALAYFFKNVNFVDKIPDTISGRIVTKGGLLLTENLIRTSNLGHLEIKTRLIELEKKKIDNKTKIESYDHEAKRIERTIDSLDEALKKTRLDLNEVRKESFTKGRLIEIKKAEIKSIEERITELQREKAELDGRLNKTTILAHQRSNDIEGISKEIYERKQRILKLRQEENHRRSEIEKMRLERSQAQIELEGLKMKVNTSSSQLKENKNRLDEIEIKLIEVESEQKTIGPIPEEAWGRRKEIIEEVDHIEKERKNIKEKIYQMRLEVYKYEEEIKRLQEMCDGYNLEIGDDEDIPDIETIEAKISSIGIVNPLSIPQYLEEKERLSSFLNQKADVESAIDKLKTSIKKSDQNATARLVDKLQAVNLEFGLVFESVFGGGQGKVRFQDPDNPLQSPIEIVAGLEGKRIKRLSQLSSGEQSLLAITLLFAFYRVNPAPFLVLDEVDAPLDDTNVRRLSGFLKDLSKDIQIIIITHNPTTIKIADYLYGVTMEERGVSKVVAVDFRDVARIME